MSDQKTTISVSAKAKTRTALNSVKGDLKKTSREAQGLAARFRSVARATVIMEGPLGGTAGRLSAVATMMNSVSASTIAVGVGITAMTAAVFSSMKRFGEFEKQTFKINALLEQTGYASGQTADSIEDMSQRIARDTLESTNGLREASGVLLSFRSVAGSAFERTLKVATDLSAITGQDLKSSVIQLGKALEDPMTGMTALRRSGVSFTNSQKEMIVAMKDAGDTAKAQSEVLKILEGQLGGAGAGQSRGLAGAVDSMSQSWDNLLTNMASTGAGQAATEFLNRMARGLQNIADLAKDNEPHEEFNRLLVERAKVLKTIDTLQEGLDVIPPALQWRIDRLNEEAEALKKLMVVQSNKIKLESQAGSDAHIRSQQAQKDIAAQNQAEVAAAETKKRLLAEQKQLEKDERSAEQYGEKLIAENQKFQNSLLEKSHQEDLYLDERLTKIEENRAAGLITQQMADEQEAVAYELHNAKLTEIHRKSDEKRTKISDQQAKLRLQATQGALNDISTLTTSENKKLFKIGKAASYAQALINTYLGVTKTMASVPYPWNIPLAAAQLAAGMVQVQNIKAQKFQGGSREFGGAVIGGRTYKVNERGDELFTAPRTGHIINNNTTNQLLNGGGGSRTLNLNIYAMDTQTMKEFVTTNRQLFYNVVVDAMNEEGKAFA